MSFIYILFALFAFIQSITGVGILLFGTPTLLLAGYSFSETLSLVLPSSLLVSFLQIKNHTSLVVNLNLIYVYILPFVILGIFLALFFDNFINVNVH